MQSYKLNPMCDFYVAIHLLFSHILTKAEVGQEFSRCVHGVDDIVDYTGCYGLSEQQVMELCEHLDADREGANNWITLAEWFTSKGYRFIRKAEHMQHPTRELLKVFFEVCRVRGIEGRDAVEYLIRVFTELRLENAVQILSN